MQKPYNSSISFPHFVLCHTLSKQHRMLNKNFIAFFFIQKNLLAFSSSFLTLDLGMNFQETVTYRFIVT